MMRPPNVHVGATDSPENGDVMAPQVEGRAKLLVTVEEASHLLSIHRTTIYDMLGRGDLPSVKIGRRRLISRQALIDFISRSEHEGSSP